MFDQHTLAIIFISLTGLATLLYAILDGYDLGVGILLPLNQSEQADTMIASIGPFWDANETWLVLAVGLLLIAFPAAHSEILKALYIPATIMLIGLILRGVAFDFRAKVAQTNKPIWDRFFKIGSLITALSQGYMLGMYVVGFNTDASSLIFALLSAIGVACAYCFIGATWLVMKTEGQLQIKALKIAKRCVVITFLGVTSVSLLNLVVNPTIYEKWFSFPTALILLPIPIICAALFVLCFVVLNHLEKDAQIGTGLPFATAVLIFTLSFFGLSYSFFPYIIPSKVTIWQSVAAPESLNFLLWGAIIVIPTIIAYTAFSYRVFWGKVEQLKYY